MMVDNCDTPSAGYIRHRITRFGEKIQETRMHFGELSAFGRYCAAAPYLEKSGILALLDDLGLEPATREELCWEFREALGQLAALEQEFGEAYREKLRSELRVSVDAYMAFVCHTNLGNPGFGSENDPFRRETIAVLLHELATDTDLDDTCRLIHMLDNRCPGSGGPEPVRGSGVTGTPASSGPEKTGKYITGNLPAGP